MKTCVQNIKEALLIFGADIEQVLKKIPVVIVIGYWHLRVHDDAIQSSRGSNPVILCIEHVLNPAPQRRPKMCGNALVGSVRFAQVLSHSDWLPLDVRLHRPSLLHNLPVTSPLHDCHSELYDIASLF